MMTYGRIPLYPALRPGGDGCGCVTLPLCDAPGSLQISLIPLANRSGQCGRVLAPPGGDMLFTVKEEDRNE